MHREWSRTKETLAAETTPHESPERRDILTIPEEPDGITCHFREDTLQIDRDN